MKKASLILGLTLILTGCAPYGSQSWYTQRLTKIEKDYRNKELTTKQYICLQTKTESIRFNDTPRLSAKRSYWCKDPGPSVEFTLTDQDD